MPVARPLERGDKHGKLGATHGRRRTGSFFVTFFDPKWRIEIRLRTFAGAIDCCDGEHRHEEGCDDLLGVRGRIMMYRSKGVCGGVTVIAAKG